jgi:hypothetical protein
VNWAPLHELDLVHQVVVASAQAYSACASARLLVKLTELSLTELYDAYY